MGNPPRVAIVIIDLVIVWGLMCMVLLNSCGSSGGNLSPERKAENAIREKFKYTLHDYASYQPVSFGVLTKLPSPSESAQRLLKNRAYLDSIAKANKDLKQDIEIYLEYQQDSLSRSQNFGPGWKMQHTFRAKVPLGGYMLHNYMIYFNIDLTEVTGILDLDDR